MPKPESQLRQRVAKLLRREGFKVQAIEDLLVGGVPDLFYWRWDVAGVKELKSLPTLPARPTTRVRLWRDDKGHQRFLRQTAWLADLWQRGLPGHVLVHVRDEDVYVLLTAWEARGVATRDVSAEEFIHRFRYWRGWGSLTEELVGTLLADADEARRPHQSRGDR
jgi:hypothetical protein